MEKEYTEYYVAFIDILGFKDLIDSNASCQDVYSVFEHLQTKSHTMYYINGEDIPAFHEVQHYIMSDSIVLYIRTDIKDSFFALIGTCLNLQKSLMYRENPVLLRGGIAKGPLFVNERIIYGKGLSDAYQIENSVAIYPRIIFNKNLLRFVEENDESVNERHWNIMLTKVDDDELCFVHYFALIGIRNLNDAPQLFDRILDLCQIYLDSSYNKSIRDKYMWLKKYLINECSLQCSLLKDLPNGKSFLQKWNIFYKTNKIKKINEQESK